MVLAPAQRSDGMTKTVSKPKGQTWVDWMPPGSPEPFLLTRSELLQELADQGISISFRSLENWQAKGVIPRPVRRRHAGSTQAMYPTWIIGAIKHLKYAQDRGMALEKIAPLMRSWATRDIQLTDPLARPKAEAQAALLAYVRAWEQSTGGSAGGVTVCVTDGQGTELASIVFSVTPENG